MITLGLVGEEGRLWACSIEGRGGGGSGGRRRVPLRLVGEEGRFGACSVEVGP